ncbi:hypothetical protein ACWPKS_12960 [Coraliomargarita sp. W4R72]
MTKYSAKQFKVYCLIAEWLMLITAGASLGSAETGVSALDYSSMDVRKGDLNRQINGYSELKHLAVLYEEEINAFYEDTQNSESLIDNPAFSASISSRQEPLLNLISEAFERPQFYFNQPITPETEIPEVGLMRYYILASMFKVRHLMSMGEEADALEQLQLRERQIELFSQSGGGLIHLLSTLACYNIWQQEVWDYLAVTSIGSEELECAARETDCFKSIPASMQSAMRHEFHFSKYWIELTLEKPLWTEEIASMDPNLKKSNSREITSAVLRQSFEKTFSPVETTNHVFSAYAEAIGEAGVFANERSYATWSEISEYRSYPKDQPLSVSNPVGRILLNILLPSIDTVQQHVDLTQFTGAATRVLFALRAFYGDVGHLPEKLEYLVPKYLEEIPRDPFDGKPIRYSKDSRIIYSVGNDFVDSGGSELPFAYEAEDSSEYAERDFAEPTISIRFASSAPIK